MLYQPLSVPEAVREVLASNNVYMQSLKMGIANYTALAQRIRPDVEKLIGARANLNTIVVAIKRFADTLEEQEKPSMSKARMSLTGSVIDVDFQKEPLAELFGVFDEFFEEGRYNVFQTDKHFTLLAEDADEIRKFVAGALEKFDGRIEEGLSKITVSLSPDEGESYQLLSLISSILYNHQIPVHSVFFTPSEMVLILNEKHAARAYDLIRKELA